MIYIIIFLFSFFQRCHKGTIKNYLLKGSSKNVFQMLVLYGTVCFFCGMV